MVKMKHCDGSNERMRFAKKHCDDLNERMKVYHNYYRLKKRGYIITYVINK